MYFRHILNVLYIMVLCITYAKITQGRGFSKPRIPAGRATCADYCAISIAGLGQGDRAQLTNQCSSYLSTSVIATLVTVTSTTVIPMISNNGNHNPTTHKPQQKRTPMTEPNDFITIAPTQIPEKPFNFPACKTYRTNDKKEQKEMYTQQFSSICACNGVTPITTFAPTITTTSIIEAPTTVSHFKLKAMFHDGKSAYLELRNAPNDTDPTIHGKYFLSFSTGDTGSALFALTNEKHLMFEKMDGIVLNSEYNLIGLQYPPQNVEFGQVLGVLGKGYSPTFFVDGSDGNGGMYEVVLEEVGDYGFFKVKWREQEETYLVVGTEGNFKGMGLGGRHQAVRVVAEPVL